MLFATTLVLLGQFIGNFNNFGIFYFLRGGLYVDGYFLASDTDLLINWLYNYPKWFANTLYIATAVYLLMTQFGLINQRWGLILIYVAGAPMGYLTQKGFFDTIPKAIDEAAKIDGAINFQIFTKINLPLSKPIIVYTAQ